MTPTLKTPTLEPRDDADDAFWWAEPSLKALLETDPIRAGRALGLEISPGTSPHAIVEAARVLSMIWQDGRVVPKRDFRISPDDEGLLFGRGIWESTRTFDGRPWLWDAHLDRLHATATLLNLYVNPSTLPDAAAVSRFVRGLTRMDVVIRLNVSAGGRGRPGTVWMSAALPPPPIASVRLQTRPSPVPKDQPYLVWKTFQYATRLRVGRADAPGFDSTLLVDDHGRVQEAAHANIFVRTDSGWATPRFDGGLLPGTLRRHLLDASPLPIVEREIFQTELAEVREAFVTNSNIGIVPVVAIDANTYPIGHDTRRLARWLRPEPALSPEPLMTR